MSRRLVQKLLIILIMTANPGWTEPLHALDKTGTQQARIILAVEDESLLSSQIDGRIKQIKVREGERFKKGDTLVTIDCAIYKARKKRVEAELAAAHYTLKAQKKLKQLRTGSTMKIHAAQAELAKSKADLEIIQVTIDMCSIKAPFDGLVVKRAAYIKQYISKGNPLLEIIDDSTMEAHLIVPSNWLLWLKKADKFTFHLDETNQRYSATVSHIGVRIDPGSQTVILKGAIQGSHPELRVGMGGQALFSGPHQ
jgi:membrane fusion protein, multidrug efflux system